MTIQPQQTSSPHDTNGGHMFSNRQQKGFRSPKPTKKCSCNLLAPRDSWVVNFNWKVRSSEGHTYTAFQLHRGMERLCRTVVMRDMCRSTGSAKTKGYVKQMSTVSPRILVLMLENRTERKNHPNRGAHKWKLENHIPLIGWWLSVLLAGRGGKCNLKGNETVRLICIFRLKVQSFLCWNAMHWWWWWLLPWQWRWFPLK